MIIKTELDIPIYGYKGVGKTYFNAATEYIGHSLHGLLGDSHAKLYLKGEKKLSGVVKRIKSNNFESTGTKATTCYNYQIMYKGKDNLWAQTFANIRLWDRRGGDFDYLQQRQANVDTDVTVFSNGFGFKGIILLFNLEQFFGCKNYCQNCQEKFNIKCNDFEPYGSNRQHISSSEYCTYINRQHVYNFLESAHKIAKECNIPISIAVNHCVDNTFIKDEEHRNELIKKARDLLENNYIKKVFYDIEQKPNVYFIDSVAAIKGYKDYANTLALPLLDLLIPYLDEADTVNFGTSHDFVWGNTEKLKEECLTLIKQKISQQR